MRAKIGQKKGIVEMMIEAMGLAVGVLDGADKVLKSFDEPGLCIISLRQLILFITHAMERHMEDAKNAPPLTCRAAKRRRGPGGDDYSPGGMPLLARTLAL